MFSVSTISRAACRFGCSSFALRFSWQSYTGYVACVGFRSPEQARRLALFAAPRLPSRCKGVLVRRKQGRWWVSIPVTEESVPEEVAQGVAVCSAGSPSQIRRLFVDTGRA